MLVWPFMAPSLHETGIEDGGPGMKDQSNGSQLSYSSESEESETESDFESESSEDSDTDAEDGYV
jgi:hypothetical protein